MALAMLRPMQSLRKLVLVFVTLVVASHAAMQAVVGVLRAKNPEIAMRFSNLDAIANAKSAIRVVFLTKSANDLSRSRQFALNGLHQQPLNAAALGALGMVESLQGKQELARKLMTLADKMSRRELSVQLWLIEDGVRRDDVRGILHRYDIALRSSEEVKSVLFPILLNALSNEEIADGFGRMARTAPPWLPYFYSYAIREGGRPDVVADASRRAGGMPKDAVFRDLEGYVVAGLAAQEKYAQAFDYFAQLGPELAAATARPAVDLQTSDPRFVPITWGFEATADLNGSFIMEEGVPSLFVTAAAGTAGIVAHRILRLHKGTYRFYGKTRAVDARPAPALVWKMECLLDRTAHQIWIEKWAANTVAPIERAIDIGSECPFQRLSLSVDNSNINEESMVQIQDLQFR